MRLTKANAHTCAMRACARRHSVALAGDVSGGSAWERFTHTSSLHLQVAQHLLAGLIPPPSPPPPTTTTVFASPHNPSTSAATHETAHLQHTLPPPPPPLATAITATATSSTTATAAPLTAQGVRGAWAQVRHHTAYSRAAREPQAERLAVVRRVLGLLPGGCQVGRCCAYVCGAGGVGVRAIISSPGLLPR
jgi:hypothetical protein